MRWLAIGLALALAGCVSERTLALELRPPRAADGGPDVPADVAAFEVRLSRLEGAERCPTADEAAAAIGGGRLGDAQTFTASEGMGRAIGEVPPGRWAVAALARDASCALRLYGCAEVRIGEEAPDVVVVDLAPAESAEACGACRSCDGAGGCEPVLLACD